MHWMCYNVSNQIKLFYHLDPSSIWYSSAPPACGQKTCEIWNGIAPTRVLTLTLLYTSSQEPMGVLLHYLLTSLTVKMSHPKPQCSDSLNPRMYPYRGIHAGNTITIIHASCVFISIQQFISLLPWSPNECSSLHPLLWYMPYQGRSIQP
jgi:hypothetical protein